MPRLTRATGLVLLVTIGLLGVRFVALPRLGRYLVVVDPLPAHADAIVVMAGAPAQRLLEAARLHRRGIAPRILLTTERRPTGTTALAAEGVHIPEKHDLSRRALRELDVPDDAIVTLRRRTWSTASETVAVVRYACRHDYRSLVVVTSPSHTRRTSLLMRRAADNRVDITMRPATAAYFPATTWWRRRHVTKRVLYEYQKLVNYWLRERWVLGGCEAPGANLEPGP